MSRELAERLDELIQEMCSEPAKSPLEELIIDAFMEIAAAEKDRDQAA